MQLVTQYRLRLADSRDPRLGELGADYELAAVGWTGARSALVGFFHPQADPAAQTADLLRRIGAALRWGDARLHLQGAQRCDILLVALGPLGVRLPATAHPSVSVGVVWADTATGDAEAVLPPPPGTPTVKEIRAIARTLHDGAEAPTLAAVDLAERQAVAGGTIAPTRRVLVATPRLTYVLVGVFVGIFLIENTVINRYSAQSYGDLGYLGSGALIFGESEFGQNGSDWWRLLSTAFLHVPGGIGVTTYLSVHLLVNCYSTVVLGRIVEPLYGRLMMLATFVATAFAASLVSVAAASLGLPGASFGTVGASGGLMGLLGLLLVLGRRQGKDVPVGLVRALRQGVILSVILTAAMGFLLFPYINNYAHLGGFCAGALIGLVMPPVHAVGGPSRHLGEGDFRRGHRRRRRGTALRRRQPGLGAHHLPRLGERRLLTSRSRPRVESRDPGCQRMGSSDRLRPHRAPQPLEVVEEPLSGHEDVGDDAVEVDTGPGGVTQPGDVQRPHPLGPARLLDIVNNGTNLTVRVALADDEEVGDGGLAAEVDVDDVAGLLVGGGGADHRRELLGRHAPGIMASPPCRSGLTGRGPVRR